MGGGKKAKTPDTPDYSALAKQQGDSNYQIAKDVTAWNRPNQIDQYGNTLTWTQTPSTAVQSPEYLAAQGLYERYKKNVETGAIRVDDMDFARNRIAQYKKAADDLRNGGETQWTQTVTLSPQQKALQDKYLANQTAALGGLNSSLAAMLKQGGFDVSKFKTSTKPMGAYSANLPTYDERNGKAVSDALYRSVMDRARPQQQQDMAAMQNQLRQQGLQPGTEAYDRAIRNLMTSQGDVNAQAANQATIGGYEEARNRYLAQLQGSAEGRQGYLANLQANDQNFTQSLQSNAQNFGQALSGYNQPLQNAAAYAALAGNAPSPQFSGFSGATGYNPADLLGAANASYQAQMGAANSSNAKKGSTLGAGLGFAGSFLGGK